MPRSGSTLIPNTRSSGLPRVGGSGNADVAPCTDVAVITCGNLRITHTQQGYARASTRRLSCSRISNRSVPSRSARLICWAIRLLLSLE
jgi:hypothetical protein